jgi:hypothetical protein
MVDGSRCGRVVHGGAVLVAATGGSEGVALHSGSTTAEQGSAVGVTSGRKKGYSRGGVGLPL